MTSILHQQTNQPQFSAFLNQLSIGMLSLIIIAMIISFFAWKYFFKSKRIYKDKSAFNNEKYLKIKWFKQTKQIEYKWLHRILWYSIIFVVILIIILGVVFMIKFQEINS